MARSCCLTCLKIEGSNLLKQSVEANLGGCVMRGTFNKILLTAWFPGMVSVVIMIRNL